MCSDTGGGTTPGGMLVRVVKPSERASCSGLSCVGVDVTTGTSNVVLRCGKRTNLRRTVGATMEGKVPIIAIVDSTIRDHHRDFIKIDSCRLNVTCKRVITGCISRGAGGVLVLRGQSVSSVGRDRVCARVDGTIGVTTNSRSVRVGKEGLLSAKAFRARRTIASVFRRGQGIPSVLIYVSRRAARYTERTVLSFGLTKGIGVVNCCASRSVLTTIRGNIVSIAYSISAARLKRCDIRTIADCVSSKEAGSFCGMSVGFLSEATIGGVEERTIASRGSPLR